MRTWPLVASLLLLAGFSADLARRVTSAGGAGSGSALPRATRSKMIAALGTHETSIALEDYDGTTSVVRIVIAPGPDTRIAEVVIDKATLGGHAPQEVLPHRVVHGTQGPVEIRLSFRGVPWGPDRNDQGGYEAHEEHRLRVLYPGCDPADAKAESAGRPLFVTAGPLLERMRKHLGGK